MSRHAFPSKRARLVGSATAAVTLAITLTSCGGDDSPASSDPDQPVTLALSVFGDPANVETAVEEFESQNPNVTVELNVVASSEDARTSLLTKLAAGSGLADVEMLEISWVGQLERYSSEFVPVGDTQSGDWVPIAAEPVTNDDGDVWARSGGTGPLAMCYRQDLLEAAGMPSDREAVAEMVGGSWADFFAAGQQYVQGGGPGAWYDSSYLVFVAQVEQLPFPYEDEDGNVVVDNPEVEAIFKDTLALAPELSANLSPFSEDWNAGMGNGAFATIACPSWLTVSIEGNAPEVAGWNMANAFPGGGGNLGGSYYAVPTQSENPEQAAALAEFLTEPEQQIADFQAGGAFPSRVEALESSELRAIENEYFNNAPFGEIFADRALAIETVTYKGPAYIAIDTAAFNAITRVETGQQSVDEAWEQFVQEAEEAGQ